MHCSLWVVFCLFVSVVVVSGSPKCSGYEFPCESGDCIDAVLWCDSHVDCVDGSDEKYCKKTGLFDKDPNKCPSTYFKCKNGPCIPIVGQCDGYEDCHDSSDEKDCLHIKTSTSSTEEFTSTTASERLEQRTYVYDALSTTNATAVSTSNSKTSSPTTYETPVEHSLLYLSDSFETNNVLEDEYSQVHSLDYSKERARARDWLLSQRREDFGWGDETPRALTALFLSEVQRSAGRNESDMLMVKQLEVQLSLDISRNGTNVIKLTDLALYINAISASCKDPANFYGDNLIRTLRNGVDAAQRVGTLVNPSVYMTLCINNATTYVDARKLHELLANRNGALTRIDIQALALLAITCINRSTTHLAASSYEDLKRQFHQNVKSKGFPGNVYEASLLFQALQETKAKMPGLLEFILREQQEDGSFGDILSTYLVLPVISGRTFLQMKEHCSQKYTTDLTPIEVLKNVKRSKVFITYSLYCGNPPEVIQTIQMRVPEGVSFLDVMRLAQDINPKYRYMLNDKSEDAVVYAIGGIPNDAEKGLFWTLHFSSNNNKARSDLGRLIPYPGNVKLLKVNANDEFVFWMKSM